MFKSILLGGLVGIALVGCSGDSTERFPEVVGKQAEALTADAPTGSTYRLNDTTFDILDHSGNRVATLDPAPDEPTVSIALKPGNYTIVLVPGWILQRKVDNGWVDMNATVTAQPIGEFWIHPDETLELHYAFAAGFTTGAATPTTPEYIDGPDVNGATGTALITIEVDDCGLYIGKISALAGFTVACRGALDSTQYAIQGGAMVRTFTSCSTGDASALAAIDGVLSLQYDRPDLVTQHPKAKRDIDINKSYSSKCIAGAWESFQTNFTANVCPNWQLASVQNPPATGAAAVVNAGLAPPVVNKKTKLSTVAPTAPALVDLEKLGNTYQVSFPAGSPAPNCGTAAECATACAAGFRGFVLSTEGTDTVLADPPYWEVSDSFPQASNPFLRAGYYHAMADYGPVPGDQFGHAQRALAYKDNKGKWWGEGCSYYSGGTRFSTTLIHNANVTGAVSWCKSPF